MNWLLNVTPAGRVNEPVGPAATKRFGGEDAERLGVVFDAWALRAGAIRIEVEANDGAHGKHDRLVTFPDGAHLAGELISGKSKGDEVRHVRAAIAAGRRYLGLCNDETIRKRVRRYFGEVGIHEDDELIRLVISEELTSV